MSKTTKATLWILGVFAALSLAVYFAGCGDDTTADAGTAAAACTAAGTKCEGGTCRDVTGGKFECIADCSGVGGDCTQTDGTTKGTCYPFDATVRGCLPTGSTAVGSACETSSACVAGAVCTGINPYECYLVCDTATPCEDTTATCDAVEDLGVSVCIAAE